MKILPKSARLKARLRNGRIVIAAVCSDDLANQAAAFRLAHLLFEGGVEVEVKLVPREGKRRLREILRQRSSPDKQREEAA